MCEDIKVGGVADAKGEAEDNSTFFTLDKSYGLEHLPQNNGTCAFGYELEFGSLTPYGSCEGSAEFGVCILPPLLAAARCEEDPVCSGVSETTNTVWQASYPGKQILGRAPAKSSFEWKSCMKAAPSRTWDHLVANAASLLEEETAKRSGGEKRSTEQKQKKHKHHHKAENVAGLGPALSQWL